MEQWEAELRERKEPAVIYCMAHAPYDGCFHELNYWLLKQNQVYPLYVSGRIYKELGLNATEQPWLQPTDVDCFIKYLLASPTYTYTDVEVWELGTWTPMNEVLNSTTVILNQHEVVTPRWTCSKCNSEYRGRVFFLGYTGNGGIGIRLTEPVCEDCFYSDGHCEEHGSVRCNGGVWCPSCQRFMDELDTPLHVTDNGPRCPRCDTKVVEVAEDHCPICSEPLDPQEDAATIFELDGQRFMVGGQDWDDVRCRRVE